MFEIPILGIVETITALSALSATQIGAVAAVGFAGASVVNAFRGPPKTQTPSPRKVDPTPRQAGVENQEATRAATFRRLARLRRSTLISQDGQAEPTTLSTRLSGAP